ncbi:hypothetical protein GJ744_004196 [Endocarpon pusillum]|uniref:Uncharacterized protein n=1 Tax=Endocarpon pusillum TaxID=364733 RepID=A0A8H7A890_9EURO|nr:hypothetical protein GJ744_004196 [Endocarpon pusillum]
MAIFLRSSIRFNSTLGCCGRGSLKAAFQAPRSSIRLYHGAAARKAAVAAAVQSSPTPIPPFMEAKSQLNVLQRLHDPAFYEGIAKLMDLRRKYIEDRSIFIRGEDMIPLLKALGVKDSDFAPLKLVSDHLGVDPTLNYREIKNGRFCFDFDTQSIRRLEKQPFTLSVGEEFRRHDSGKIREFEEVDNDLQLNTVLQALMVFKVFFFAGVPTAPRDLLDYSSNKFICTLFNTRTFTDRNVLGEPALEGVHTDGVDHTMTTLLGSNNMTSDSAITLMHDMREVTGSRLNNSQPALIKGHCQHRNFLDTMIIADTERKHSLTPVYAQDEAKRATRDMLIFFTRRPTLPGHVSYNIDSTNSHTRLPMEIPMWVPQTPAP